jgi:hypothetical protein
MQSEGTERRSAIAHVITRLESEFELRRAQINAGHSLQGELWEQFIQLQRQVEDLFASHSWDEADEEQIRIRARFGNIQERIAAFREQWKAPVPLTSPSADLKAEPTLAEQTFPSSLDGLHQIQTAGDTQSYQISLWVADRRWIRGLITAAAFLSLLAIVRIYRRYLTFNVLDWLISHPRVVWLLVGIGWWGLLAPSWIGLAICGLVLLSIIIYRRKPAEAATDVDFVLGRG